jgi:subtilase family serine protease
MRRLTSMALLLSAASAALIAMTAVASAAPYAAIVAPARSAGLTDLGSVGGSQPITLSVVMRFRDDAQLDQFVDAVSDPASPMFRHFLTNVQFRAAFAPSAQAERQVTGLLTRAGFSVSASPDGTILHAVAPAAVVERYFNTRIDAVRQAGASGIRYANVAPAFVPGALGGAVRDVIGFDDLHGPTTDHILAQSDGLPDKLGPPLKGPHGGYGPFAIAQAYNYPVQHGFGGHGQAVAIAIDYDSSDNDLSAFTTFFNIHRTGKVVHVPVDGGQAYNPNGSVESTLDTETVGAMDPGADMYVYNFGAAFTWTEITDAYAKAVSDDLVEVVSSSFGLCEDDVAQSVIDTITMITKEGAAEGISFVASTGDFGRGGKCSDATGQDVPAVTRYFTSVGGVDPTIDTNGNLVSQHEDSGSGGGPSDIFPIPHYQVGLAGVFSTTTRNIPDVSGPYFPDAFYINGSWGVIGGTSWAAPATAAFLGQVDQVEGSRIGFANPALYRTFKLHGYGIYTDVVSGNNGIACLTGYDDCSGIGSILGLQLARKI